MSLVPMLWSPEGSEGTFGGMQGPVGHVSLGREGERLEDGVGGRRVW